MAALYDGEPLITTEAVLLEIGNALAREYKPQAVEVIEEFLASEEVEVVALTPELFAQAFALYRSHEDKEWGLVDCLSFVVMRERGVTDALTSDRHFIQAGYQAVMRE